MMLTTLPVLMALSWTPALPMAQAPAPAQAPPPAAKASAQQPAQQATASGTITCPLNGEQIPACCCPIKR